MQDPANISIEQPAQAGKASEPATGEVPVNVWSRLSWRFAVRLVAAAIAGFVLAWLVVNLQLILIEAFIAIVLTTGLSTLTHALQNFGLPRLAAILLIVLLVFLLVGIFGVFVIPALVEQTTNFVSQVPALAQAAESQLQQLQQRFPSLPPLGKELQSLLSSIGAALVGAAGALVGTAVRLVVATIFILLITVYLLVDGLRVREYLFSLLPVRQRDRARSLTDSMGERVGHWLIGQAALCLIFGVTSFILLTLLGVPGALVLAVFGALCEFLPNIGGFLAGAAAVLVALTQSPLLALWTALGYLVLTQVDGYLITPKVMGRAVKLHPLAIILALIAGAELLGPVGTLISIPLAAALAVLVDEVRSAHRRAASVSEESG